MIKLKPMSDQDYHLMRIWRNADRYSFINPEIITHEMHENWYKHFKATKSQVHYIIYHGDTPIGGIGLDGLVPGKSAEISRVVLGDKRYARKGMMGEALETMMAMHGKLDYHLKALADNTPAVNFYKKHGFKEVERNINHRGISIVRMKKIYESS